MEETPTPLNLRRGLLLVVAAVLVFTLYLRNTPPTGQDPVLSLKGQTMGTSYEVQLSGELAGSTQSELRDEVQTLLRYLDKEVFSTWESESEIGRLNQAQPPVTLTVSAHMHEVTRLAREVFLLSEGAFDPSVGPLVNLWGFGPEFSPDNIPSPEAIAQAREKLGFDSIRLEEGQLTISKQGDVVLDYSAIAKGYAVDQVAHLLDNHGLENYLVEIGGELLVRGERAPGQEWRIGIEAPQDGPRSLFQAIGNDAQRFAIAASGNYRNFFEMEGQVYSHEIDPVTGWPVAHELVSVTVIHASAAMADALATALMVMGPERARTLATGSQLPVYLIMRSGTGYQSWHSSAFSGFLRDSESSNQQDIE